MNRYVLTGLMGDAHAGKRVIFVGDNRDHARAAFEAMASMARPEDSVRRAAGNERIATPTGGSVAFASAATVARSVRGMSLDVAFVDTDLRDDAAVGSLFAAVASSGGDVLRR